MKRKNRELLLYGIFLACLGFLGCQGEFEQDDAYDPDQYEERRLLP